MKEALEWQANQYAAENAGARIQELEAIRAANKHLETMLERQKEEHWKEVERMKVRRHFIPRGAILIIGSDIERIRDGHPSS